MAGIGALALAGVLAVPAHALTLKRADLNNLVTGNGTIVVVSVEGASSHWNQDNSLILTDFRLQASQVLKGRVGSTLTITQMGGTAGKYTTLIPGSANLIPGRSYVLFLREEKLPGSSAVTTVAEHCQGAFDLETRNGVVWAVSQAAGESLIPDDEEREGDADVPGGSKGMALTDLVRSIQSIVASGTDGGGK
ncbi:MAG: hypothetical protein ABJC13_10995 [Acidobacteriota bacterium]